MNWKTLQILNKYRKNKKQMFLSNRKITNRMITNNLKNKSKKKVHQLLSLWKRKSRINQFR